MFLLIFRSNTLKHLSFSVLKSTQYYFCRIFETLYYGLRQQYSHTCAHTCYVLHSDEEDKQNHCNQRGMRRWRGKRGRRPPSLRHFWTLLLPICASVTLFPLVHPWKLFAVSRQRLAGLAADEREAPWRCVFAGCTNCQCNVRARRCTLHSR